MNMDPDAMVTWWKNPRMGGGLRLTKKGFKYMKKVFGKPCMHSEYEAIRPPENPQKVNKKPCMHSGGFLRVFYGLWGLSEATSSESAENLGLRISEDTR